MTITVIGRYHRTVSLVKQIYARPPRQSSGVAIQFGDLVWYLAAAMATLNPDLVAALVTLAGVGGTASLGLLAVRRARAARRRQIEGAGEPRRATGKPARPALKPEDLEEPGGEPAEASPTPVEPVPARGPVPAPTRPPAQVLPFPTP